ncbi:hypothetical protein PIB30_065764 [Stylosanthes scabra]|uniref:RNase H type-1 domain-containing protein n=1 Tax=Stylosanthes scabra TaxID=79078 RepID=A0ABU6ZKV5_9FABA|nr:hypothetical protein [Stylosanthes scabra]
MTLEPEYRYSKENGNEVYCYLGECSVTQAELLGILDEIRLACDLGMRRIVMESDYKEAIEGIQAAIKKNKYHNNTIGEILNFKNRPWELLFHHCYRETNTCAN